MSRNNKGNKNSKDLMCKFVTISMGCGVFFAISSIFAITITQPVLSLTLKILAGGFGLGCIGSMLMTFAAMAKQLISDYSKDSEVIDENLEEINDNLSKDLSYLVSEGYEKVAEDGNQPKSVLDTNNKLIKKSIKRLVETNKMLSRKKKYEPINAERKADEQTNEYFD